MQTSGGGHSTKTVRKPCSVELSGLEISGLWGSLFPQSEWQWWCRQALSGMRFRKATVVLPPLVHLARGKEAGVSKCSGASSRTSAFSPFGPWGPCRPGSELSLLLTFLSGPLSSAWLWRVPLEQVSVGC